MGHFNSLCCGGVLFMLPDDFCGGDDGEDKEGAECENRLNK